MISRVLIDVMNYAHLYLVFSYFAVWPTKLSHVLNHITVLNQLWTFHISNIYGPSMCINEREKVAMASWTVLIMSDHFHYQFSFEENCSKSYLGAKADKTYQQGMENLVSHPAS